MLALVTGASRGIGAATAKKLAAEGYFVLVHYHHAKEKALRLAEEINGATICSDLGDFTEIDHMVEKIETQFGAIDVLVNNAGMALSGLYQDISDMDAIRLFMVNVGGVMHTTKRILPQMIRKQRGCIVNIASMWGETGAACEVHYSAAKAAIIGFTKALAKEVAPSGVRVNCVSPGVIDTDMNRVHDAETMAILADETPLGRIGTPEQIADAITFLASDRASFITGQILSVNGGYLI